MTQVVSKGISQVLGAWYFIKNCMRELLISFRALVTCLIWVYVGTPCLGQGVIRWNISFDGFPMIPVGTGQVVTNYSESAFFFEGINSGERFIRVGGGRSGFPENGTAYVTLSAFDSLACTASFGRFGLYSVDLSEFSTLYQEPKVIQFVGYKSGGQVVTTEFTTDGIIDGTGPLADFQTFYFDSRFEDIIRLEVPTVGIALDNLVVQSVPEPQTSLLLLTAAAVLSRRFQRKN